MTTQKTAFRSNRRGFFKQIAFLGSGAAALSMSRKGGTPKNRSPAGGTVPAKGYRVTPHIRKYYETAGM